MNSKKLLGLVILLLSFSRLTHLSAQIAPGVYVSDIENVRHELKLSDDYFIHTIYENSPARFIKTTGGFYTIEDAVINVKLEFNSNYEADSIKVLSIPFSNENNQLVLGMTPRLTFNQIENQEQSLDGQWLFATRGPDTGQERRGDENPRKTLKFLQDNRFQWIAYNTETFKFSGTGGGSFSSVDGNYVEIIDFFSRDDSRVGAQLEFKYELKGNDWHHTGQNSKGEPMYEIWARR